MGRKQAQYLAWANSPKKAYPWASAQQHTKLYLTTQIPTSRRKQHQTISGQTYHNTVNSCEPTNLTIHNPRDTSTNTMIESNQILNINPFICPVPMCFEIQKNQGEQTLPTQKNPPYPSQDPNSDSLTIEQVLQLYVLATTLIPPPQI